MKTKEFDEAIQFYNNSIKLDSDEPTTYCNRALAFIKIKKYENALSDCNKAIELKQDYSKAYYRRAVCFMGLQKFQESLNDLLFVLIGAPSSPEVTEELKTLKEKWMQNVPKENWVKIENDINDKVEMAKDPKKKDELMKNLIKTEKEKISQKKESENIKSTQTSQNAQPTSNFKKIKIVEDVVEDKTNISPELSINIIFI